MGMSSKRAGSKALEELITLFGEAVFGKSEVDFRYSAVRVSGVPRSTYRYRLHKFQRQGLIKKKPNRPGSIFVITQKAKLLRRKAVVKKMRHDGFATLIIFDIPEEKHNARDTLRRFLVRNGYTKLRESCFISPFEISADLKDLVSELKLEQDVSYFSAKPEYYTKVIFQ